jgi:hypothetical protein
VTSLHHHLIKITAPADGADYAAGLPAMPPNLWSGRRGYLSTSRSRARRAVLRKNSGSSGTRSPAQQRPNLKAGEVFHIAQTRSVSGPQAPARSRRHHKTSEPHLYFPRRRRALQGERTQRACPSSGPHGRSGTMPRMRRGDFDQTDRTYGRTRHRTPHVRMQAMPRATSVHRRSCERNYSCDATLAGRPRRAPPIPPGGEPRLSLGRGSSLRPVAIYGGVRTEGG